MKKFAFFLLSLLCLTLSDAACKDPARLSVLSFNVRLGVAKDGPNSWEFRRDAAAEMIGDRKPDLFGVQEAYDFQAAYFLERQPDYKYIGVGREDGVSKGEQMGIFYRKKDQKLIKWGTWWLSETPDIPSRGWDARCRRTATWALFKDRRSGRKFFMVNTHLDHKGKVARVKGLRLVREKIAAMNPKGWPLVLTGDFNLHHDSETIVDFNKVMQNARDVAQQGDRHGTFHGWGQRGQEPIIDYIFFSGFRSCLRFETVTKEYSGRKYVSDHYPIQAELEF